MISPRVRVYKIQRDIPMPIVINSVKHGNLSDFALKRMKDLNIICIDIRQKEERIQKIHNKVKIANFEIIRRENFANDDWETLFPMKIQSRIF